MFKVKWDAAPLDTWQPNSPYGLLRCGNENAERLVRLETVAIWLSDELPRDAVISRLIDPLYQNEAYPWGYQVFVLNGRSWADRLLLRDAPTLNTVGFWQYLGCPGFDEGVTRDSSAQDVIGLIREMWRYAWPGVCDPATDREGYIERVIAANRARNARVAADPDASRVPDSADMNSEKRQSCMRLLARLAVPVPVAFTLWGWGTAATPVADGNAAEAPDKHDGADGYSTKTLVAERKKFIGLPKNKRQRAKWTAQQLQQLPAAVDSYGGAAGLAKELDISDTQVRAKLRLAKAMADAKEKADAAKAEAAPQNPNDVLRTLGKPGTAASNSGITSTVYHDGKEVTKNKPRFAA